MNVKQLQNGDAVYAAVNITNDGSVPHAAPNELFARRGTIGMLLNTGHLEEDPSKELYLVSFQTDEGELGPPVTCFEHEISVTPIQ